MPSEYNVYLSTVLQTLQQGPPIDVNHSNENTGAPGEDDGDARGQRNNASRSRVSDYI